MMRMITTAAPSERKPREHSMRPAALRILLVTFLVVWGACTGRVGSVCPVGRGGEVATPGPGSLVARGAQVATPGPEYSAKTAPPHLPRHATPLDIYVRAPDPAYSYRPVSVIEGEGYTAHVLELTSQTWRKPEEVDRTVWKHWVTVYVPQVVQHRTALLYIGGGRSSDPPPSKAHPLLSRIATATHSVTVHLQQVPNQPLIFAGETTPRREDALIAYTWDRFLRTGDPTWIPRLPMTKSAVRAMDAVVDFCARPEIGSLPIDGFVVAGSSKRGWTTWTTAAVDPRVVAIVPMVIDLLNVEASFRHHYRSYGSWSPAIQEFVDLGITEWLGSRQFRALERVEDPYFYRERLKLPKLIVNATGDPFFLPDSSRFYFADLPGEKYLRYVPNTDHSLNDTDTEESLQAFYQAVLEGAPRPEFSWRLDGEASIRLRTDATRPPSEVRLWQAANPDGRDFRMATIGKTWKSSILEPRGRGVYVGSIARPERGWAAFFLELTYRGTGREPLKFTTAVRVVPDTLPYSWHGREREKTHQFSGGLRGGRSATEASHPRTRLEGDPGSER